MAKLKHVNLFGVGDKAAVYAALQRDLNRGTWVQVFWHAVLVALAVGATVQHPDRLWLFGGIYAAERALACFVDNSNRNWAMHVIDWLEHNREAR